MIYTLLLFTSDYYIIPACCSFCVILLLNQPVVFNVSGSISIETRSKTTQYIYGVMWLSYHWEYNYCNRF